MDIQAALAGGMLIGIASLLLYGAVGRIAGISGITFGSIRASVGDRAWRYCFIGGLILGGWIMLSAGAPRPATVLGEAEFPTWLIVVSGLLVGAGTRIGSGCTSGHGVCGISRLSARSLTAVVVFMAMGMLMATLIRPIILGAA